MRQIITIAYDDVAILGPALGETMPDYFQRGQKPANPVNQTNRCDVCEPTLIVAQLNGLVYDTERDAMVTFNVLGQAILNNAVPGLWALLWQNFRCTNQLCLNKDPCGAAPTWVEVGSHPVRNAAGNIQWQIYVELAREIQCVAEGGGQDCPPEIPETPPPEPPPSPTPSVPEPQRFPDDGSGLTLYGHATIWSGEPVDLSKITITPEKKKPGRSKK